jgi:hypothetical protein
MVSHIALFLCEKLPYLYTSFLKPVLIALQAFSMCVYTTKYNKHGIIFFSSNVTNGINYLAIDRENNKRSMLSLTMKGYIYMSYRSYGFIEVITSIEVLSKL